MRLLSALRPSFSLAAVRGSARSNSSPQIHTSFRDVADQYDAFILDQFGVLHNGVEALEGAPECVEYLYRKNKKLIILSNTSAPSDKALLKLPKLGFDRSHFVDAVTSGEEASRFVKQVYGSQEETTKALFITWDALKPNNPRVTAPPLAFIEQCGNVEVVPNIEEADLILLHGSEVWYRGESIAQEPLGSFIEDGNFQVIDSILEKCLARHLPLVCANPDRMVVTPTGGSAFMPGRIAERYEEMGGDCKVFGKPDTEHFLACIRKLGLEKDRVAHVGDSLHHDIAGAIAANIPSIFVTSGIHASDLGTTFGVMPDKEALDRLFEEEGMIEPPTHIVSTFQL